MVAQDPWVSWEAVGDVVLGQLLSLLVTVTAVCSELLVTRGFYAPTAQVRNPSSLWTACVRPPSLAWLVPTASCRTHRAWHAEQSALPLHRRHFPNPNRVVQQQCGGEQQSVATPQAKRGWTHPP
jgi:hypothetical protein